jgi:conjugal transfer pilus assembly protein TraL
MDTPRKLLIPRRVDDPLRFFLWDADVAILCICGLTLGIVMEIPLIGSGAGFAAAWAYGRFKGGSTRGFAMHALYWHAGLPLGSRTPPSRKRHFIG